MKAILCTAYGPPDVLELKDIEKPAPDENQVLVKVHAASVNAGDWRAMRANPFLIRLGEGLLRPKNPRVGSDVAGRVEETPEYEPVLATGPKTHWLEIGGLGTVLFCHSTPRSETEVFTRLTPEARLVPLFDGLGATVVVCGHTHMQFDRMIGATRVVNAGSVGMPFGEPGAYWVMLGSEVQLRHTPYDLVRAADLVQATSYPQAAEFAAGNVLHPPSEAEMLEAFGRTELR